MIEVTPSPSSPAAAIRGRSLFEPPPPSPRTGVDERADAGARSRDREAAPADRRGGVARDRPADRPRVDVTPPDLSGTTLCARYELVRRIGHGGMGEVYEARFLASGQRVAIKILFARLAASEEMLTRFRHELRVLETIKHPAIVGVRDFDFADDGRPYLVMEYLEGEDLSRRRRRPIGEVIRIGLQVCEALEVLHAHGIIHRDLTRRNLIALGDGADVRVKVIDFGVSKLGAAHYAEARPYMTPPEQRLKTRTGLFFGTPGYMAPEATEEPPCPRQDVYSLGVVLFELLVGRQPLRAWLVEIPDDVDHDELGLDALTWRVLLKAIEPDPALRYQSATTFKEAIKDLQLNVDEVDDEGAGEREVEPLRSRRERAPRAEAMPAVRAAAATKVIGEKGPGLGWKIAVVALGLYVVIDLAMHAFGDRERAGERATDEVEARELRGRDRASNRARSPSGAPQIEIRSAPEGADREIEPREDPAPDALSTPTTDSQPPSMPPAAAINAKGLTTQVDAAVARSPGAPRTLSAASFRKTLAPHRDELALCTAGLADPAAQSASVRVAADGVVVRVRVAPEVSYVVERCVARAIETIQFPAADAPSTHTVRFGAR